ncbi:MAG: dienelactone hydrolase family protein, partial [Planctomycetes bacterium]|nr:dienelactone hydrolase family protein [Planctomycetota bacterium]
RSHLTGRWKTMIRDYAESLASSGFVAMIPDFLAVTGTTPGKAALVSLSTNRGKWQTAISDAIDHSKGLPAVDTARIGLLGFSLGGHLCLRLRAKGKILVEYFAPILDGIGPAGTLKRAQIHHGEADHFPGTGFSNAKTIRKRLELEGTSTEVFAYPGAGHGFIGDDQANADARTLSKEATLTFFQIHL